MNKKMLFLSFLFWGTSAVSNAQNITFDVTVAGDLIVGGLTANSFIYANASKQLTAVTPSNAGDVIQWNGSSFVASNDLDGGTF